MQETSLNPADEIIEEDMEVGPSPTKMTALDFILGEEFACANPPNPTKKRTPTLPEQARLEVKAYTALPGILLSSCPFALKLCKVCSWHSCHIDLCPVNGFSLQQEI
ncbi:hypothetical protein CAPTEDRAFT_196124 [Capitella teleta]|uniref:Uncharacterized protein n=1 Tax=Capitella teleta TaxID=283909 RepID=R7T588_CAPTE|nr:hypothetical protein CAPTEDRAFT_196124 [Capitella teleta]|eukprot:ELT88474.1 hypothetical protein CAPTEDRAFT_196124 [Capitella teleta]